MPTNKAPLPKNPALTRARAAVKRAIQKFTTTREAYSWKGATTVKERIKIEADFTLAPERLQRALNAFERVIRTDERQRTLNRVSSVVRNMERYTPSCRVHADGAHEEGADQSDKGAFLLRASLLRQLDHLPHED